MFELVKIVIAQGTVETDFGPATGIGQYVNNILTWLMPVVGGLAFLMLIYAGYLYMTSQGNPDNINQAKEILIGVIVGVILLFGISLILREIGI